MLAMPCLTLGMIPAALDIRLQHLEGRSALSGMWAAGGCGEECGLAARALCCCVCAGHMKRSVAQSSREWAVASFSA